MNLQKIQIQREGHRRFIEKYLEKIEQSKENDPLTAILSAIEAKVTILETLNEKILSQTEIEGLEEEIYQKQTRIQQNWISSCVAYELSEIKRRREQSRILPIYHEMTREIEVISRATIMV
ncbi:hypothetical protein DPMN_127724 [Dreissena polymorpha]|uniref:Uncharacterized protein n=1 Tax=Dreissena polymorpha TaxID=45954 RepID=A0A9D4GY49_DREPO|nr:hypothetical protein DPMN_127724 [Dreissena polymorpha]